MQRETMMAVFGFNLFGLVGRSRAERRGYELYGEAVRAARSPLYYAELGVPDTLDGRFDMVGLHAYLLIRHLTLRPDGQPTAQAIFDAMFNDMDVNLREMGVGDLSVGKKVRVMWEAFHGRAQAYSEALKDGRAALALALSRNLWPDAEQPPDAADALAGLVIAQDAALSRCDLKGWAPGMALFQSPESLLGVQAA